ncbi:MAG: MFS transporter [Actinobacteria bacterium]|nr:MFS transporter [Actinomycetota bacterium]
MGEHSKPAGTRPRLRGWRHPAVLSVAGLSVASGFAQFAVTASLGDVAAAFGEVREGASVAARAGLSGTTLGVGLSIVRLASILSLPLAGLADAMGRRRVVLGACAGGLALTAAAALSPGWVWFVLIAALGRPLLSTTNAVAGVVAAEETPSRDRAKAIALVAAGYGVGAGVFVVARWAVGGILGFRGMFALALPALAVVPLLGRRLDEPDRFTRLRPSLRSAARGALPVLGPLRGHLRARLGLLGGLTVAIALVTGPINTYLFIYGENVLGMSIGALAVLVAAAGPAGLAGLVVGRWTADRLGRRVSAGLAQVAVAVAGMLTYVGSPATVVGGYLTSVLFASAYTPAYGALSVELFPTSVRSTAAGWLTAAGVVGASAGILLFGVLAEALGDFARAAAAVALPVAAASVLFARLPETRGQELEQSAPEGEPPVNP